MAELRGRGSRSGGVARRHPSSASAGHCVGLQRLCRPTKPVTCTRNNSPLGWILPLEYTFWRRWAKIPRHVIVSKGEPSPLSPSGACQHTTNRDLDRDARRSDGPTDPGLSMSETNVPPIHKRSGARSRRLLGGLYEKRGALRWPDWIRVKCPNSFEMLAAHNLERHTLVGTRRRIAKIGTRQLEDARMCSR